jgi:hypothetical protein
MSGMIGDNTQTIDYAREESERLQRDYAELARTAQSLFDEAAEVPDVIEVEHKSAVVELIKRIRDVTKRVTGIHELEKLPHLRRGQGVDNFFFGLHDSLMRRDKKNRPGIGDTLNQRLTELDVRLLAEENERRRLAAEEAARIARAKAEAEAKAAREADEKRLAAERARLAETRAAKQEAAAEAERAASAAIVEAKVAEAAAEEAHVATLSRPADIMRQRTAAGTLSTMQQETFAEIEDPALLDAIRLWTFVTFEAKQKALNGWARSTDWREQMPGARVGRRPKSQVR